MEGDLHRSLECDLCGAGTLTKAYSVPDSARGAQIWSCDVCGLLQSFYTQGSHPHAPTTDSGPGWGNVRHGKGLRFEAVSPLLDQIMPRAQVPVLDVGANRGAFLEWMQTHRPGWSVDVVEPDQQLAQDLQLLQNIRFLGYRVEDVEFAPDNYGFVFCLHTLEHLPSAKSFMNQMKGASSDAVQMLLEVPDTRLISDPLIIEEYFIDKHSFHFDSSTLQRLAITSGWNKIDGLPRDGRNIGGAYQAARIALQQESSETPIEVALVEEYAETLARNRTLLPTVARKLESLVARQKVVFWGGGRSLDALVRFGAFEPTSKTVVDTFLTGKVKSPWNTPILAPTELTNIEVDCVVVFAKGASHAIGSQLEHFGIQNIVYFEELLEVFVGN